MTGKETYARAIELRNPSYLPCTLGVDLDWLQDKDEAKRARVRELAVLFPDDLLGGLDGARNAVEPVRRDGVIRWTDEWQTDGPTIRYGAKTLRLPSERGYGGGTRGLYLPRSRPPRAVRRGRRAVAAMRRSPRPVHGSFTLFERLWMLRGFENLLMDPYTNERESSGPSARPRRRLQPGHHRPVDRTRRRCGLSPTTGAGSEGS